MATAGHACLRRPRASSRPSSSECNRHRRRGCGHSPLLPGGNRNPLAPEWIAWGYPSAALRPALAGRDDLQHDQAPAGFGRQRPHLLVPVPRVDVQSRHPQCPHPLCAKRTVKTSRVKGFIQSTPDPFFPFYIFRALTPARRGERTFLSHCTRRAFIARACLTCSALRGFLPIRLVISCGSFRIS